MNGRSVGLTAVTYLVLFVLGGMQGLIGSFQYSRYAPGLAIAFALLIAITCALAAWGMGTATGAFVPGAGWLIASFIISMSRPTGSVIIAATSAGEWYLYGGTLAVAASVVAAMAFWRRPRPS